MRNKWYAFLRFGVVGVLGFAVDTLVVALPRLVHGNLYLAQGIAYLVAATFTWWFNRRFTFKVTTSPTIREWVAYLITNLSGGIANYVVFIIATRWSSFIYTHPVIAIGMGSLCGMVFNFIFSSLFVFTAKHAREVD